MAAITVRNATDPLADSSPTDVLTAVGTADTLANDGETVLFVDNTDASSQTVTVTGASSGLAPGKTQESSVVTLATSKTALIGPFPKEIWGTSITVDASSTNVVGAAYKAVAKVGTASDFATVGELKAAVDAVLAGASLTAEEGRVFKRVRRALVVAGKRLDGFNADPNVHL